MEVEVHSGMVNYFKVGPLTKKKVKRFAVLYEHSNLGVQRLEMYDSKETFEKKDKWKKHAHIINLERCTNVVVDQFNEGKKVEDGIILQFESDDKPQTFTLETEDDLLTWLQRLQSVLFGKKESLVNEHSFEVEIKPNDMAQKQNLKGAYLLSISLDNLELLDRQTRKPVVTWPLHLLRKYGRDRQEFTIEAGRRCTTGEGLFTFKTDHYNAIFRQVESNVKTHIARSRTSSNASLKAPPVKHQPPIEPPVSTKIPSPSSVYESPLDAKPAADSSDLYSEPINLQPASSKKGKTVPTSKQNGQSKKSKGFLSGLALGPKKPPRKNTASPDPLSEATYSNPVELEKEKGDLSDEYSHIKINGGAASEAEYDSISYPSQWKTTPGEENAYATTSNPSAPPPDDDGVYDRVHR